MCSLAGQDRASGDALFHEKALGTLRCPEPRETPSERGGRGAACVPKIWGQQSWIVEIHGPWVLRLTALGSRLVALCWVGDAKLLAVTETGSLLWASVDSVRGLDAWNQARRCTRFFARGPWKSAEMLGISAVTDVCNLFEWLPQALWKTDAEYDVSVNAVQQLQAVSEDGGPLMDWQIHPACLAVSMRETGQADNLVGLMVDEIDGLYCILARVEAWFYVYPPFHWQLVLLVLSRE